MKERFLIKYSKSLFFIFILPCVVLWGSPAWANVSFVTVRSGDTLGRIAYYNHTTVSSIMQLNGLRGHIIYPGEKLKVKGPAEYRRHISYSHYRVQFGDSLSVIAQKYGTSVAELRRLNNLHSNVIRQGALIVVPEPGQGTTHYSGANNHIVVSTVTVHKGDTLGRIAYYNHTTVSSIMQLNGLRGHIIYPGEKLKVKGPAEYRRHISYSHYRVQFGDSLSVIAQKYGTSVAELRRLNNLHSNVIRQGALIVVPGKYYPFNESSSFVTVYTGDTLDRIAYDNHTTVSRIMYLNGLKSHYIYPGEKLKVKGSPLYHPLYSHYRVQFGDSLSVIAQKYGTSVAELRRLNNLHSNVIRQGALIVVPESYNGNDSLGKKIVRIAYQYRGVPYVWGGTTRRGMDCSAFVQSVFAREHIILPRTTWEQAKLGKYVPKSKLKPGDLVFFRTYAPYISHVGIYVGHGKFIQENSGAGKVTVTSLYTRYFERTYAFAKSIR